MNSQENISRTFVTAALLSILGTTMFVYLAVIFSQGLKNGGAGFSGYIYLVLYAPIIFFGLYAGILVDKYPRKFILLISQSTTIICVCVISIYVYSGKEVSKNILVTTCLLVGCAISFLPAVRFAMIGDYIEKDKIPTYTIFLTMSVVLCAILGPIMVGFLVDYFSWIGGFSLVILSYLLSNLFILRLPVVFRGYESIEEGVFKYIRSNLVIVNTLCFVIVASFIFGSLQIISPYLAKSFYSLDEKHRGLFTAITGVGFLVGGALSIKIHNSIHNAKIVQTCIVLTSIAVASSLALVNIFWSASCIFFSCVFGSISLSVLTAKLQSVINDRFRGAVMALFNIFQLISMSLGALLAGVSIDLKGIKFSLVSLAIASVTMLIFCKLFMDENEKNKLNANYKKEVVS